MVTNFTGFNWFWVGDPRFSLFLRQFQATVTQQEVSSPPFFNSETLGLSMVVFGIAVIALAAWRYNRVFWQIERGDYRPNRVLVWILAGTVMILGTLSIPCCSGESAEI